MLRAEARVTQVRHGHGQLELVVEVRRPAEPHRGLREHHVDAALEHRLIAPVRGAPQLGHADVEVGQIVRVEDDALNVALAVANPYGVDERAPHQPPPPSTNPRAASSASASSNAPKSRRSSASTGAGSEPGAAAAPPRAQRLRT